MNRSAAILATLATSTALVTLTATTASATEKPGSSKADDAVISSTPHEGTGGLILRDINGRDLGSGIGENQYFGFTSCGPKGSGLIKVVQITRGKGGGWGSLYEGYVKQRYTQLPSMFPCNK